MKFIKKFIGIFLSVAMIIPFGGVAASANTVQNSIYFKGVFCYRPGIGEYLSATDEADYYIYSDDFFRSPGKEFNRHLATLSMSLAEASVGSLREPNNAEGYLKKSRNAVAFLEDTGFSDIEINEDYKTKPTKDTMGVGCAHKTVTDEGKDYTLLVIFPRNAGYEAEWGNNFVLGSDGDADGFNRASDICLDFARSYISKHQIRGDLKLWAVGFSRGAAVAGIMAKKLIDNPFEWLGDSVKLDSDNIYAYMFGTPLSADADNSPRDERYAGIFNCYENTELASSLPPAAMGFERYGSDRMIFKPERYDDMLGFLEITNPYFHEKFAGEFSSKHFAPKTITITDGSVSIADDKYSYIPDDPVIYLEGLGTYLAEVTAGREGFSKTYEQPLSDLFSYFQSLTGDDFDAFLSSLTSDDESLYLIAGLYAYFMKCKQSESQVSSESALTTTKELAAVSAGVSQEGENGFDCALIAKVSAKLVAYLMQDSMTIKADAAKHLGAVLKNSMTVSNATEEQISTLTSQESLDSFVHLFSHLLFGNIWQNKRVHPLLINNQQIKNAATLIGNFANLFVDHANEVILSWLRTEDELFTDYAPLTEAQLAFYRRVYISSGDTEVNGEITDASNKKVAEIRNGVLVSSDDAWVGFTATDDGGFFRIPSDRDYMIKLVTESEGTVSVKIGEYSPCDAEVEFPYEKAVSVIAKDTVTVSLPAPADNYSVPSDAAYKVSVGEGCLLGDASNDGRVNISDVTLIQKHIAGYSLSDFSDKAADVNFDGVININDATLIQKYLANYVTDYPINRIIQ